MAQFHLLFELQQIRLKKNYPPFFKSCQGEAQSPLTHILLLYFRSWLEICSFSYSPEDQIRPLVPLATVMLCGMPGWEGEVAAAFYTCSR